ncbi:MAG: ATP-grasp domain-containing protein, partial [Chloroflexota bacterium]|nr:ATP-grasp domain-containing protein [Chloroflexota bacterium]
RQKVIILGGGPNRIGQGIEFDYCCCHASFALREMGLETIMVNCNPETVSTDYDTSDRHYFEPLTVEDVRNIIDVETAGHPGSLLGVIVQFGGQTPLNLAPALHRAGVPILGTSPDSLDLAEDRQRFGALLAGLNIPMPESGTALTVEEGLAVARRIGYPLLVRPSYVLGGRGMAIVYDDTALAGYLAAAMASGDGHPILLDRYLEDAIELDVDALADGHRVVIGAIMQHVEAAGIHSGDSACVLPPYILTDEQMSTVRRHTESLGLALHVVGLLNIQYAIHRGTVYVLEVNPRASRTVPFVSKATGRPLAKIATKVMAGMTLQELGITTEAAPRGVAVKEVVLPFVK